MFCPKCGNEVPDNSMFCPKCGNKFAGQASSPAANTVISEKSKPAGSAINIGTVSLSGVQIVGLVFSVVAIITALMPWFITSNSLIQAGNAGASMSSFLTMGSYSTAQFEESYTMFSMNDFVADLGTYLSASSSSNGGVLAVLVPLWAISLIVLVAGAILFALRRTKPLIIIGAAALLLVAAYYQFGLYNAFVQGGYAVSCMNPIICMVACIATIVCAIITKRVKAN